MIELIALACSLLSPFNCKDVSLAVAEITPMQCVMGAQSRASEWIDQHPGWRIAKLTCGKLGRYAKA